MAALAALGLSVVTQLARAADTTPSGSTSTFAYTTPAESHPLRAVLELQAVFALGFVWYATTGNLVQRWDVGFDAERFRDKITGRAFGPDTNHFGTNFIGHPLGGTGYYLAARGNRLSILQSFGFSLAGSLLWELFGEIREQVSLNDSVITPLGGIAIGEPLFQLGAFFDRQPGTPGRRLLGSVFGPSKTLNDWFDDLELARSGVRDEWQRAEFSVAALTQRGRVSEHSRTDTHPALLLAVGSRLVRLPGYDGVGQHSLTFADANVSALRLQLSLSPTGVSQASFKTTLIVAGHYARDAWVAPSGGLRGYSRIVGLALGFSYELHHLRPSFGGEPDRIATVQPLGVAFEQRLELPWGRLSTTLGVGLTFGGVRPLSLAAPAAEVERFPAVLRMHDYYFGTGGHVNSGLTLSTRRFVASGEFSSGVLTDVGGPHDPVRVRLTDVHADLRAHAAFAVRRGFWLRVLAERRVRVSHVGSLRTDGSELSIGSGLGAEF